MVLPAPVGWSGVSPYFACCPSSSVPKRSSFGTSASGFRFKSLRWGHPSGSGLSQSSIGSKALAPPSWCMLASLRDGVTLSGRGLFQISIGTEDLFGAPSLVVGVLAFAMGSPILGRVALFCALDRNRRLPPFIYP